MSEVDEQPAAGPPTRVQVVNPADGGYFYWLGKLLAFAVLVLLATLAYVSMSVYARFSSAAPPVPDLSRYAEVSAGVTRLWAGDGTLLGEFAEERREVVPYDQLPDLLVKAFLAAEDHRFFEHGGIDFMGIARAAWRNLATGEFSQGGSTITQQVAKQFLVLELGEKGSMKTLERKATEAIMARRLEAAYSKREILAVYANHIFLGSGAYGVQAAARTYFSRNVWELELPELALIAGLAQAPSRDSPLVSLEAARKRRDQVLDKMARHGFITAAQADQAKAAPVRVDPRKDVFLELSPYFTEHVRTQLRKRYGDQQLMRGGLTVETSILPWVDGVAYENVDFGARKQDKRQGWRGPEAHLEGAARDTFLERAAERYGDTAPAPGRRVLALVDAVEGGHARVLVGRQPFKLPLAAMDWAAKWSTVHDTNDQKIGSVREALRPGDVVWVSRPAPRAGKFLDWTLDEKMNARWLGEKPREVPADVVQLEQPPHPQMSIFTFDHHTGYVLAMVGGSDYDRSQFNRVTNRDACRSPGSTYKPIYYSAALDQGYGFDTVLNDIPKAEVDPITGEVWTPENLHGTQDVQVTLEYALVFSKNVPSVDIFKKVGAQAVEAWARRLGFTSPIIADRALALGASCVYTDELARAFAIFARNGRGLELVTVRRVLDRGGNVIEDHTVPGDPMLRVDERLDRVARVAGIQPPQVISARTAFLTSKLLRAMVRDGYNGNLRATGVLSAGKTGTSSRTMDLWFVGYTARWMTSVWLGDDRYERQLGRFDAAYMTAVPMWARYMYEVTRGQTFPEIPWEVPEGVKPGDRGGNKGAGGTAKGLGGGLPGEGPDPGDG
jgi:penicillin-binding protein 1A